MNTEHKINDEQLEKAWMEVWACRLSPEEFEEMYLLIRAYLGLPFKRYPDCERAKLERLIDGGE